MINTIGYVVEIVDKLFDIVVRLYTETEGYIGNPSEVQLWYNRGYANGVVSVLRSKELLETLGSQLVLDADTRHQGENFMEWEKAYHHGFEMGEREAREVLPV